MHIVLTLLLFFLYYVTFFCDLGSRLFKAVSKINPLKLYFWFSGHLARRPKWAFLITSCSLSVVVHVVVVAVVVHFSHFVFFTRTTRPISTKLGAKNSWLKRIVFVHMKGHVVFQGDKGRWLRKSKHNF